jgi:hypothetical protein
MRLKTLDFFTLITKGITQIQEQIYEVPGSY